MIVRRLSWVCAVLCALAAACPAAPVRAEPLGTAIPAHCHVHTSFSGGADLADDYRCAGMAIDFHAAGPGASPFPIWAGQWLFVDEGGQFRVGSCTFNRGIHPSIAAPSAAVGQALVNDPTSTKSAYLTWRYGDTTDDLIAAALWAVFHYYAQDAAGSNRSAAATQALVPRLDLVGDRSGRDDIEQLAVRLDAEAQARTSAFTLDLRLEPAGGGAGMLTASVRSGAVGIDGVPVLLGDGSSLTTGADGVVRYLISLPAGRSTITATAPRPGAAVVYRGRPAGSDPHGAQTLITGGEADRIGAQVSIDVPLPTTSTTTTTVPPPTTTTSTTTTIPPSSTTTSTSTSTTSTSSTTTSTTTTSTAAPTSTTIRSSTTSTTIRPSTTTSTTTAPVSSTSSTTTTTSPAAAPPPRLPSAGGGGVEGWPGYVGVFSVVAGAGLVDAVRRRARGSP